MTSKNIEELLNNYLHYSSRYQFSKDTPEQYEETLQALSKQELIEILSQIGFNCDLEQIEKQLNQ